MSKVKVTIITVCFFLSSHDFIYAVFCKMVNFGPINPKFGSVVYWVTLGPTQEIMSDWGHNIDVMAIVWPFYGSIMNKWELVTFQAFISQKLD